MKCQYCGAEVLEGRFCNYCGSELPDEPTISIKGDNNTIINNNFFAKEREKKEYYQPELEKFYPRDFTGYKHELIKKSIVGFACGIIVFIYFCITTNAVVSTLVFVLLIVLACKLYDKYKVECARFQLEEYDREDAINEINYQREYDAWFNSLSEEEKQTELLRQILERNKETE